MGKSPRRRCWTTGETIIGSWLKASRHLTGSWDGSGSSSNGGGHHYRRIGTGTSILNAQCKTKCSVLLNNDGLWSVNKSINIALV